MSDTEKGPTTIMGPDRQKKEVPEDEDSPDRDLSMPQMVVAMGTDSSDDDDNDHSDVDEVVGPQGEGYMLLPNADQDVEQEHNEVMDSEDFVATSSSLQDQEQQPQQQQQQSNLPPHLAKLLPSQVPSQDPSTIVSFTDTPKTLEARRQIMAKDDEIRKAMVGFSLPGSAVPPWARALDDKEWKEQLTVMMQSREKKMDSTGTSRDRKT